MTKLEELDAKERAAYKALTDAEDAANKALRPLKDTWSEIYHELHKELLRAQLLQEIRQEDEANKGKA